MNAVTGPRPLPVLECLRLLRSVPVGRIAFTRNALPAVEPVRFTFDSGRIFFALSWDSALYSAIYQCIVAFQADSTGAADGGGWTVTVIGNAGEVTDPPRVVKLRNTGLGSWVASDRDHFMDIAPGIVTGQRLAGQRDWPAAACS